MIRKTPFTQQHIDILTLYHSLKLSGFGKTKIKKIEEIQRRLKIYTKSSIKNIVDRYYENFLESLEELKKVSVNLSKEDLTKIYNLENLTEKQMNFIFNFLSGMKPVEAAEKAGYSCPAPSASRLLKNKKIQSIFEEQRKIYLETSKFGLIQALGKLESIIEQATTGYEAIESIEKEIARNGKLEQTTEIKTKTVKDLSTAVTAISVWADITGAKAIDGVRDASTRVKIEELEFKREESKVRQDLLKRKIDLIDREKNNSSKLLD